MRAILRLVEIIALGDVGCLVLMEMGKQKRSGAAPPLFWVVVEDHQTKVFAVFGPLSKDIEWTNRVAFARERGRDVTICTVTSEGDANIITGNLTQHGFARSTVAIL